MDSFSSRRVLSAGPAGVAAGRCLVPRVGVEGADAGDDGLE